jgi:hypothetical protein
MGRIHTVYRYFFNRLFFALDYLTAWFLYLIDQKDQTAKVAAKVDHSLLKLKPVVILAIFQNGKLCPNFMQMVDAWKQTGVGLLIINNGRLPESEAIKLRDGAALYHERPSGHGRDFASYKLGVQIIRALEASQDLQTDRVIFANDSVLVVPGRFEEFLSDFLANKGEWVGVTETTEGRYHVSSWLFSVSRSAWNHPKFIKYWRRYRPLHSRRHNIKKGELAISTTLTKQKFAPHILKSAAPYIDSMWRTPWSELVEHATLLALPFLQKYSSQMGQEKGKDLQRASYIWRVLLDQDGTNQTAFWQLYACVHGDFPFVKKDIYFRRVYSISQIRLFAQYFVKGDPQRQYIVDRVVGVQDPKTLSRYRRIRYDLGLD